MNRCTEFHDNPSNICRNVLLWLKSRALQENMRTDQSMQKIVTELEQTNVLKTYEIQRCIYSWRFSFPFFSNESKEGREPFHIWKAECRDGCKIPNMPNMVPKTIVVEISVYQRLHQAHPNNTRWCKCPYELAVGCTCVNKITATE